MAENLKQDVVLKMLELHQTLPEQLLSELVGFPCENQLKELKKKKKIRSTIRGKGYHNIWTLYTTREKVPTGAALDRDLKIGYFCAVSQRLPKPNEKKFPPYLRVQEDFVQPFFPDYVFPANSHPWVVQRQLGSDQARLMQVLFLSEYSADFLNEGFPDIVNKVTHSAMRAWIHRQRLGFLILMEDKKVPRKLYNEMKETKFVKDHNIYIQVRHAHGTATLHEHLSKKDIPNGGAGDSSEDGH